MTQNPKKKLTVRRQTIRVLAELDLAHARGGVDTAATCATPIIDTQATCVLSVRC